MIVASDMQFEEDPPRDLSGAELGAHRADDFLLNIDGYEGPIDILLIMARDQKVDLSKISILQLARQYLEFVDRAQELNLELAAEYLVMAAWLAYLKSRLLLPVSEDEDEPSGEEMAAALQFQLQRLEAMQDVAEKLFDLPQLGESIFPRGMADGLETISSTVWDVTLYDVLKAYGDIQRRKESDHYELPTFRLMSMESALERMETMLGKLPKKGPYSVWTTLNSFLPDNIKDRLLGRSSLASMLTAGLELAKQGKVEIRQDGLFRPVYLRASERDESEEEKDEN